MSWIPRFPEVKKNLELSNGEFGTYLSIGATGTVVAKIRVESRTNLFSLNYVYRSFNSCPSPIATNIYFC